MKTRFALLIGLLFLRGSISPLGHSIAEASPITNQTALRSLLTIPRKRDPNITLQAIQAVKSRKSANIKLVNRQGNNAKTLNLLPVVNQEDIQMKHRKLADEVLRSLPSKCQSALKHFYVRYDNPSRRGLAGKNTIILDGSVADDEFKALLVHEFGHITDLGCTQGSANSAPSIFKDGSETINADDLSVSFYSISWSNSKMQKADSDPQDFVSGYSEWDPFEDFAETFAYYVLQNESFRVRARANKVLAEKYRWMAENIFKSTPQVATGKYVWDGTVPWDTTKLSYEWKPEKTEVAVK